MSDQASAAGAGATSGATIGSAAGPWGAAAGAVIGGAMGYLGAKDSNSTAKQIAYDQMLFQDRMSKTAYRRAMNDMKLAGLNPMLAYSQGGASTPQGASYTPQNELGELGRGIEKASSSALEVLNLKRQAQATESQIGVNEITKIKTAADTQSSLATAAQTAAQTEKTKKETELLDKMFPSKKGALDAKTAEIKQRTTHESFYTDSYRSEAGLDKKTTDLKQSPLYFIMDKAADLTGKILGTGASSAKGFQRLVTPRRR